MAALLDADGRFLRFMAFWYSCGREGAPSSQHEGAQTVKLLQRTCHCCVSRIHESLAAARRAISSCMDSVAPLWKSTNAKGCSDDMHVFLAKQSWRAGLASDEGHLRPCRPVLYSEAREFDTRRQSLSYFV